MKRKIVLIIAIGVFLFSAYQLFNIYQEYYKGTKEYKEVRDDIITKVEPSEDSDLKETNKEEKLTAEEFQVDFDKLLEINKDAIAWIRFDNPEKINYPVVQTTDNNTYLTKTITGQQNSSGSIFMDMINESDFTDRNTFLYGHNMKNGAMFGELDKYKASDFCEKHPYFYIYTPDGKVRTYQVFAVAIVEDDSASYQIHFEYEKDFLAYVDMVRKVSLYDTKVPVGGEDTIVSLSTCTNTTATQRLIVHGVLIETKMAE